MSLKYTIGDLVWAKLRGQCPWPGRVSDPPIDLDFPKENSDYHCVYFFGFKNYKWVRERNLKPYEKFQEEMMRYCTTNGFINALNQIVEYMENPEKFAEFGYEVDIKEEVDDPKVEFKEEVDDPNVNTEVEVDDPTNVGTEVEGDDPKVGIETEVDDLKVDIAAELDDPKVDIAAEVNEPKVDSESNVDDPKVNIEEEVDVPMQFSDDQRLSDDSNDYEPMDTSIVEQEIDKNIKCPMRVQVLLPRVTIYECEACAVCFLKRKEFEQHKKKHAKEKEAEDKTIDTRKEYDNFNNNSSVSDKNVNEKRPITFTILDNEIKLKFKNGRLDVPPLLNPVVALDRIEANKCKMCDQCFVDPQEYRIHEMTHLNTERFKVKADEKHERHKPHKCSKCDAKFVLKSTLDVHSVVHEPFKFTCHCGVGYYRFGEYKGHRKLVHNETVWEREDTSKVESVQKSEGESQRKAQKSKCKYEVDDNVLSANRRYPNGASKQDNFTIKTKLGLAPRSRVMFLGKGNKLKTKKKNRRKQKKRNKPEKTFSCTFCEKSFSYKKYLEIHQVVHTKEKPFPCDQCGKRFTQIGALKLHLKRHAGIKDFACQYCPKLFYNTGSRNLHERTHTGAKPYHCDRCTKEFSDPSSYQRHVRTHTGEKRYKCDLCNKSYTESGPLQRHKITVHDKSKAIICKMCSKSFCFPFEYRKHVKVEHAEEDSD